MGRVATFEAQDHKPPTEIEQRAAAGRTVLRRPLDPLSSAAVTAFFKELYFLKGEQAVDAPQILTAIAERTRSLDFPFATVAASFRLIEDTMVPVIVPRDDEARRLVQALEHAPYIGRIMRGLQAYTVGVPRRTRAALIASGAVVPVRQADFPDQFAVLANMDIYRADVGLTWHEPTVREAVGMVF